MEENTLQKDTNQPKPSVAQPNKFKTKNIIFFVILIAILLLSFILGLYKSRTRNSKTSIQSFTPTSSTNAHIPTIIEQNNTNQTIHSDDIKIVDGNIYYKNQLLINKKDFYSRKVYSYSSDEFGDQFYFTNVRLSADKSKLIILGQGFLSQYFLFYTRLNTINVKFIDIAEDAQWSHNSQYIAYSFKHSDAGPITDLSIYDTKLDQSTPFIYKNNQKINNLTYNFLGIKQFQWTNDDSGITVNYAAYVYGNGAIEQSPVVGSGSITFPFTKK